MAEKIGVYFDKASVGPYFDFDELVEFVEGKFADLCPVVKAHAVLASDSGKQMIQADIDEGLIDSVLICGSSPRVDWQFYDFSVPTERVNLREQCALCFMEDDGSVPEPDPENVPELMLGMAQDYIKMGVVKLKNTKIPEPEAIETVRTIMVIGGGWTGLTAALHAAGGGYDVVVVEKEAELGGRAAKMHKTIPLGYPYTEAQDTGIEQKIAAVQDNPKIKVITSATVAKLSGAPGKYTAILKTGSGEETMPVGSVILAAGWVEQDTGMLAPLGYGKVPNVITAWQFEEMAKKGEIVTPAGKKAEKVAFILNTTPCEPEDLYAPKVVEEGEEAKEEKKADEESEDKYVHEDLESERHLPYANSVNTMVALKQANYVSGNGNGGVAYIFYDSMVVPGIHERYYKAAQDSLGVMLTKGLVTSVEADGDGALVTATNTLLGQDVQVGVDLVVVPTGIVPATAKSPVLNFEYRQGPNFPDLELFDGFADSNYICFPYETRRTGVYAAGAVRQPMLMDQAAEDAAGAALKAIQCLESADRGVSVHPRSGDRSYPVFNFMRCTQCKRCTEECPFGALDDDEKGTPMPNPTRCRRCGTCMGACPERVISFDNYGIGMLSEMIRQYDVPDDINEGGPRILVLACENDAYPALDMAAIRGHKWSPYIRIIPVRCLGSVNAVWIKDAMSRGTDGVMLLGCKYGDDYQCHFVKGSEICNRRKENIAETLNQLGIEPERVEQYEIAIDEYDKVPGLIEEFMKMILEKGPNPFKGY